MRTESTASGRSERNAAIQPAERKLQVRLPFSTCLTETNLLDEREQRENASAPSLDLVGHLVRIVQIDFDLIDQFVLVRTHVTSRRNLNRAPGLLTRSFRTPETT